MTDTIGRIDLLYDPQVLRNARDRYGPPTEIKANVDTTAKVYEIRTALRFWGGGQDGVRTNTCVWRRLKWHDEEGIHPLECEQI